MKLIKFSHREDFGTDWYVQVLFTKRWALFQGSVSWNDFPSWPYLQMKSGTGDVLNVFFWAYKFGIDVTILGRTWNLNHNIEEYTDERVEEFLKTDEC